MNRFQRKESREIKHLIKYWWMAKNEKYKRFRREYRKLKRNTTKSRGVINE